MTNNSLSYIYKYNFIYAYKLIFNVFFIQRSTSATAYQQSWFGQSSNQLWFMRPVCRTSDISFGMCDVYHEDYYGYHHCAQSHEAGVTCGSTNKGTFDNDLNNNMTIEKQLIID